MAPRLTVASQHSVEFASPQKKEEPPQKAAAATTAAIPSHLSGEELEAYLRVQRKLEAGDTPSIRELMAQNAANLKLLQQPQVTHKPRTEMRMDTDGPSLAAAAGRSTAAPAPTDIPSEGKIVDPKYSLVCCEVIRRLILRPTVGEPLTTDVTRIYKQPEILLALDVFAPVEVNFLSSQFLNKKVIWTQHSSTSPPFVEGDGAADGPGTLNRSIQRLFRVFSLDSETAGQARARAELTRGTCVYSHRLQQSDTADFFRPDDRGTILLFLKSTRDFDDDFLPADTGGGRLDFYDLGFCANAREGSALFLPPSVDWSDLPAAGEDGARLALIVRLSS